MTNPATFPDSSTVLPRRLSDGITTQAVGEGTGQETLLYDESRHAAFCLNPVAAAVWAQCDGTRTQPQIAALASSTMGTTVTLEAVEMAVAQLLADGLLVQNVPVALLAGPAMSRRRLVMGVGAGAALMVPAVAMVLAPKAAQAYGGCFNCSSAVPAGSQRQGAASPAAAKLARDSQLRHPTQH